MMGRIPSFAAVAMLCAVMSVPLATVSSSPAEAGCRDDRREFREGRREVLRERREVRRELRPWC